MTGKNKILLGIFVSIFLIGFASAGTWTDSFEDRLWAYYTLNESTGNFTDLQQNTTGGKFLIETANSRGIQNPTIKGGSVNFTTAGDYLNISGNVQSPNVYPANLTARSINFWIYDNTFTNTGANAVYFHDDGCAEERNYWILNAQIFIQFGINSAELNSVGFPSPNQWHMITHTWDGTTSVFYLDGVKNITAVAGGTMNQNHRGLIFVGNECKPRLARADAHIDEFGFWTRNLTQAEITTLYDGGVGTFPPVEPSEVASQLRVNLDSPLNNTFTNNRSYIFNSTINMTGGNVTNGTLHLWYANNHTLLNATTNVLTGMQNSTGWNITGINNGTYVWNVLGNGINGTGTTIAWNNTNRTITFDFFVPLINISFPQNTTYKTSALAINFTASDSNLNSCWYSNNSGANNFTLSSCASVIYGASQGSTTIRVYANDTLNQQNSSEVTFFVDSIVPNITFVAPTETSNAQLNRNNTLINVTSTEVALANITIFLINSTGGLINRTTTTSSPNFVNITNLADGNYSFNATAFDTFGNFNRTETRNITIDTGAPTLNVTAPSGNITYHRLGNNLTLNWTFTESNPDECIFEYNGANTTLVCADLNYSFSHIYSVKSLKFYANDTFGNSIVDTSAWDFVVFDNNRTFTSPVGEISSQTFTLNATLLSSLSSTTAFLWYNNTQHSTSASLVGGNTIYSTTLNTPQTDTSVNKTFFWEFRLSGSPTTNRINTTTSNQTVNPLNLDDCGSNTLLILNYTLKDEEDLTIVIPNGNTTNSTIEVEVLITSITDGSIEINFSRSYNNTNPARVCINAGVLNTSSYRMDALARYFYTSVSEGAHVTEFHNIQNYTLNNNTIPIDISLLDLLTADSQEFLITFKDSRFIPVANALIDISRKYIGEGVFRSVEVPKTDSDGQTLGHFVLGDIIYTLIVSKDGRILATFNNIRPFCEDVATGNCKINLNEPSSALETDDFISAKGIDFNFVFDKDTRTFTILYTTKTGASATVDLNVTRFDIFGNQTVCSDTETSSSATLTCVIPQSFGNITAIAVLSKDGEFITQKFVSIGQSASETFGATRIIMLLIMLITLPLLALSSGVMFIVFIIVGIAMGGLLNLIEVDSFVGVGATILWVVLAVGIIIWKVSRK